MFGVDGKSRMQIWIFCSLSFFPLSVGNHRAERNTRAAQPIARLGLLLRDDIYIRSYAWSRPLLLWIGV